MQVIIILCGWAACSIFSVLVLFPLSLMVSRSRWNADNSSDKIALAVVALMGPASVVVLTIVVIWMAMISRNAIGVFRLFQLICERIYR